MPRQNRVTPSGDLIATAERGTFMGNRGVLHADDGRIRRNWQLKRWIVCVLEFKGRKRSVMTPGHYTELFFLDEATALAAGHRPCAECRRGRFVDFCNAWQVARGREKGQSRPSAVEIDDVLHGERTRPDGAKVSPPGNLAGLPDGVFVSAREWGEQPHLIWRGHLLSWSPGCYQKRLPRLQAAEVRVLTPPSTVEAIRAGYEPEVHPSAAGLA